MKESEIRNQEVLNEYLQKVEEDVENLFKPEDFVSIPCPACGCSDQNFEFNKLGFSYVTCANCHTLYASPRPTQEQLDEFYSHSDSNKFWVEKFFMPFAEARRKKIFIPRAKEITEDFNQFSNGRVGDIGAGFGLFLEEVSKIWPNADVIAIEPSEEMAEICEKKGLKVIPQMFENVSAAEGGFDLLCAFELFEHLNNPELFLNKARGLLNRGGVFSSYNT